ncbi:MAG: DUF6495 family protein [bacterium]
MKYARLTKEQFEEMHQEFINFLATQSITADEWENIKTNKPELAEQELDIFSDLVWEGVLQKTEYLENISAQHIYLFKIEEQYFDLIGLKLTKESIDLTTKEGFGWLRDNLLDDSVEFFTAKKEIPEDKHKAIFELIQQGSHITKGELFEYFDNLLNLAN